MASNPPFQMEDQTDEDFFDKLVSDDDDIDLKGGVSLDAGVKGLCFGFGDGDDSDEGNAFANLSVDEVESDERKGENAGNDDTRRELGVGHNGEVGGVGEGIADVCVSGCNGLVVAAEPFGLGSEVESNPGNNSSEGSNGLLDAGVPFGLGSIVESNSGNNSSEGSNGLLVGGEPFGLDSGVESNCGNNSSVGLADSTLISKGSGSLGPGVKDWSAFDSDPAQDDAHGFGSYSDFFTGLDENAGDSFGNVGGSPTAEVSKPSQSEYTGVSNSYDHYQAGYGYEAAAEQGNVAQDTNSSEYWENLYPGWKIDPATGQWYQVDVHNSSASVQGNLESNPASAWSLSDGKSEVSYLQKSADSVAETMAESGRTETVTNLNQVSQFSGFDTAFSNQSQISQETENSGVASDWNQVTQVDSGYPSNMLFDPQYPGWYYDTNTQEWLSLDSYTSSAQSATQGQDLLNQTDFAGSNSYSQNDVQTSYGDHKQVNQYTGTQSHISHGQDYNSGGSLNSYNQAASGVWEPEGVTKNEMVPKYNSNQQLENHYTQDFSEINRVSQQETGGYQPSNYGKTNQVQSDFPAVSRRSHSLFSGENFTPQFNPQAMSRSHSFVSGENFMPQINHIRSEQTEQKVSSSQYFGNQNSASFPQQSFQSSQQYSYAPATGRSSAGRPPHALVTFGFGGKLIMMKDADSTGNFSFPSQNHSGYSVSVLNISEVINEKADSQSLQPSTCDYFHALCRQSLPGPLAGGNIGSKELNKWLDERISSPEIRDMDFRKSDALRQLLSLLRIACQYYGKLRSPFGSDPMMKENDLPGPAVANLFSSAKRSAAQYGAVAHCLQGLPTEAHLRATAAEVQSLLVSGRKQEALHCAQEGQLWGPALVLAAQLGNQFYVDTVKQLALRQLVAGSPLRTLCLLIAGQPADVFSMEMAASGSMPGVVNSPQQSMQLGANGMLDDWEENLAVIASNRTKDDELVLIHLGDCLWRERADVSHAFYCLPALLLNYIH
ncbi:hypothetical protein LIER_01734 [Lithospermum erythrorhizon]|uniref:Protein transport protein sec16 n=1 Tax=Lithospermum erythrorhizon TaxID=34254 RepID=A0AAV3NRJ7_LITER